LANWGEKEQKEENKLQTEQA